MAKAGKKLKVITPQTIDGQNLKYDENEKVETRTNIVELAAKKALEARNAKLPSHLRSKLIEIEVGEDGKEIGAEKPAKAAPAAKQEKQTKAEKPAKTAKTENEAGKTEIEGDKQ